MTKKLLNVKKVRKDKKKTTKTKYTVPFYRIADKSTLATTADDIDTWRQPNDPLVRIFNDTRMISNGKFSDDTEMAKKNASVVDVEDDECLLNKTKRQSIVFERIGTVRAGYTEALTKGEYDRVAILNFADALIPGGLVLYGAPTQEENICRCSNLYETLLECPMYYNLNRYLGSSKYLDIMIYSPDVLVFKDDETYQQINPVFMDVITCPAPSCGLSDANAEKLFKRRIRKILIAAQSRGVNKIVLGAWGCGAFGQNPSVVGKAFASVLKDVNAFDKVVFAIRSSAGVSGEGGNYQAFKDAFDAEYGKRK